MTDLTPIGSGNEHPPHFIVIIPGYMGSKLRNKPPARLWVDFQSILSARCGGMTG
jgi:hypothetical protein